MRRVPSCDPEQLRKLATRLRYIAVENQMRSVCRGFNPASVEATIRHLELRQRYKLPLVSLLPRFIQTIVFKRAATVPMESAIPEMIEVFAGEASSRVDLQNPIQAVIL